MPEGDARNTFEAFVNALGRFVDTPVTLFREKVVLPNQKQYPYYHQKFRRVPTIDECYSDDRVCIYEANQQYKRDRHVDDEILAIIRQRFEDCVMHESPDHKTICKPLLKTYQDASLNWFIKYGDLGAYHDAKKCYMKQKHRLIWERRHGPVGSGMKENNNNCTSEAK